MTIKAKARVQVTLEIELTQTWASTCQIEQLHHQAATDAVDSVRTLTKHGGCRIVGEPSVVGVLTSEA